MSSQENIYSSPIYQQSDSQINEQESYYSSGICQISGSRLYENIEDNYDPLTFNHTPLYVNLNYRKNKIISKKKYSLRIMISVCIGILVMVVLSGIVLTVIALKSKQIMCLKHYTTRAFIRPVNI